MSENQELHQDIETGILDSELENKVLFKVSGLSTFIFYSLIVEEDENGYKIIKFLKSNCGINSTNIYYIKGDVNIYKRGDLSSMSSFLSTLYIMIFASFVVITPILLGNGDFETSFLFFVIILVITVIYVYLMKKCESKTTINFLGGSLDSPYNLINDNNLKELTKAFKKKEFSCYT